MTVEEMMREENLTAEDLEGKITLMSGQVLPLEEALNRPILMRMHSECTLDNTPPTLDKIVVV